MTTATDLAEYLTAVAEHLRANPHLAPVCISSDKTLQVYLRDQQNGAEATAMLAWFDSLTDAEVNASPWRYSPQKYKGRAAETHVTGKTAAGVQVTAWDIVPELGKALGFTRTSNRYQQIAVDPAALRGVAAAEQKRLQAAALDSEAVNGDA